MAVRRVQLRRGNTAQNNAFTGVEGEITIDTETKSIRVHDGATGAGFDLMRADMSNNSAIATDINFTDADHTIGGAIDGNTLTLGQVNTAISIPGTLTVANYVTENDLLIQDKVIVIADGTEGAANSTDSIGILFTRTLEGGGGAQNPALFYWDEATDRFRIETNNVTEANANWTGGATGADLTLANLYATTGVDVNNNNITNVGEIELDTITFADAGTILTINLEDALNDKAFTLKDGGDTEYLTINTDAESTTLGVVAKTTTIQSNTIALGTDAANNVAITVASRTGDNDGQDLTISAGSGADSDDNLGGDLILASGSGVEIGGTSSIQFQTKVDGTSGVSEAMRIHTTGYVGIGENAPDSGLHIKGNDTKAIITLENSTGGNAQDDDPTTISFKGSGEALALAQIVGAHDGVADDDKGVLIFKPNNDGGTTEALRLDSSLKATFAGDVKISGTGNNALDFTDADVKIGHTLGADKALTIGGGTVKTTGDLTIEGKDVVLGTDGGGATTLKAATTAGGGNDLTISSGAGDNAGTNDGDLVLASGGQVGLTITADQKVAFAGAVEIATTLDMTEGAINNVTDIDLDKITNRDNNGIIIEIPDGQASGLVIEDTTGLDFITCNADSNIITLVQATSLSSTLTVSNTSNLDGGIAVDTDKFTVEGDGTGNTATKGTLTVSGNTVVGVAGEGNPNLSVINNAGATTFSVTGLTGATTIVGTSSIAGIATFKDSLAVESQPENDLGIQFNSDRGNDNINGADYDVKVIDVFKGTGNATQGTILWDDSASSFSVTTGNLHSETQFTVGPIDAPNLTVAPTTGATTLVGTDAYLTLRNNTAENTNGGAETQIQFQDHESKNLAVVKASHEGANADFKGQLLFYTNDGDDNDNGQLALTISSAQLATFAGNVTVSGNTLTFGNGATIENGGANLLTITEPTVAFSADIQVGGNITADQSEAKTIFNNVTNAQITIGSADTNNTDTVLVRQLVVVDDIDVSGAGALTVGGSVGASNLTLGGATTTVVSAGDLTVQGGANTAVLTLGQDQAQDSEITVSARTGANAGQSLTISAGSTATNGNDLNGGNLILASGGGDGTGTSDIILNTKTNGTDGATEKVRILGNGNVGIGDTSPGTMLQVSGADAYLTLKNTTAENGEGGAETKVIFEDHGNNALAQIEGSHHGTEDDNKGKLILSINDHDNGLQTALTIDSTKLATFAGAVTVTGDLIVQGDTTTLNVGTLDVEDTVIRLNKGQAENVNANDIGFFFERGVDGNGDAVGDGIFYWDEGTDFFKLGTTTDAHTATDFHANTTLGGLQLASLELLDNTASALNIKEGNDSYLNFVTTDGAEVIEFGKVFTSVSGSKIGDLTFTSSAISSGADAALTIKAETNLIFQADSDNDGGVNNIFSFLNGAGTEIAQINETGDLQIDGDLTVSGNGIDFTEGVTTIGASVGANNLTLGGATTTTITAGALTVDGATATIKGADGGSATLNLLADRGDDNGDGWKLVATDHATRTLIMSGQNVGDADYTGVLTLTADDIATSTNASFAGSVTVANGLDLTDSAITNVTDIALDSITADDANTITINLAQAGGGTALTIKDDDGVGVNTLLSVDATNDASKVSITTNTFETSATTSVSLLGGVVINEGGADKDFRVEGTGRANALVVDGTNGNVGVGVAEAGTMLQIEGANAYLTLKNSTAENGDGGAETKIIFEDHGNNALGQIEVNHQDGVDDEFGRMIFSTNNDAGLQTALTIDKDQLATFVGDISIEGAEATSANLYIKADEGDDAGDEWRVQANTNDTFSIGNDKALAGTYVSILTLTGNALATSTNATFAGEVTISGTGTNALDFSANDITIGNAIANNTLTLGASNSTVAVAGVLTVSGGDATITGIQGGVATLNLVADEGDDNGDAWKVVVADHAARTLTISGQNVGDANYTDILTLTSDDVGTSTNASFAGDLTVLGGKVNLTNGSIIDSTTVGTLLLTEDIVKTSGDLLVGGNDIINANGDTVITFAGAGVSTTLTATTTIASGILQVNGNITGDADEAKAIFATTTTEGNLITLGGGGTVKTAGKLRVTGNHIEDSGNSTAIQFDGSQNTTVLGNLTVAGVITGSSGATGSTLFADRVLYIANGNTSDDRDIGYVGRYQDAGGTNFLMGCIYEPSQLDNDGKVGAFKLFHGRTSITEPAKTYDVPDSDLAIVDVGTLRGGSALGADNTAGANLTISGGLSTGNATGGEVVFKTGGTGAGGATENATTTALTIDNAQKTTLNVAGAGIEITKSLATHTEGDNVNVVAELSSRAISLTYTFDGGALANASTSEIITVTTDKATATSVVIGTSSLDATVDVFGVSATGFKFRFTNISGGDFANASTGKFNFVIL